MEVFFVSEDGAVGGGSALGIVSFEDGSGADEDGCVCGGCCVYVGDGAGVVVLDVFWVGFGEGCVGAFWGVCGDDGYGGCEAGGSELDYWAELVVVAI